jgi:hypothetical protein
MSQWNGKGSRPRPLSVPRDVRDANWDLIFKKKDKVDGKDSNAHQDGQSTIGTTESNTAEGNVGKV